jgi:hypothetical protein
MKAHLGIAVLAFAATTVMAAPAEAAAGEAKGLGEKYQLIISADRLVPLFSYASGSISRTENNINLNTSQSGSGISLLFGRNLGTEGLLVNVHTIPRVAFDFTVIPKLTLGAALAFGFGLGGSIERETLVGPTTTTVRTDAPTASAIGLAPRVGYIIPLGEHLAFWPRGGFGFYWVSQKTETLDNNDPNAVRTETTTDNFISLDLDPQLVITPVEHFFFHVGPLANIPLSGSRSTTEAQGTTTRTTSNDLSLFHLGISAGLGGFFTL